MRLVIFITFFVWLGQADAVQAQKNDKAWGNTVECFRLVIKAQKINPSTGYMNLPTANGIATASVVDETAAALSAMEKASWTDNQTKDSIKELINQTKEYYQCNEKGFATPQVWGKSNEELLKRYSQLCRLTDGGIEILPLSSYFWVFTAAKLTGLYSSMPNQAKNELWKNAFENLKKSIKTIKPADSEYPAISALFNRGGRPLNFNMSDADRARAKELCPAKYTQEDTLMKDFYFYGKSYSSVGRPNGTRCRAIPGKYRCPSAFGPPVKIETAVSPQDDSAGSAGE